MTLTKEKIESEIARLMAEEVVLWADFQRFQRELEGIELPMTAARKRWSDARQRLETMKAALTLLEEMK